MNTHNDGVDLNHTEAQTPSHVAEEERGYAAELLADENLDHWKAEHAPIEPHPEEIKAWELGEPQDYEIFDADALDWETSSPDNFDIHHELGMDFSDDNGMER